MILLPDNTTAGKVVSRWEISFAIKSPLAVGQYIDIGLPGFESPSPDQDSVFSFDVTAKRVDPEFPPRLPEPQPEHELLGCYEDVRIKRAVGGGTCGNFRDGNAIVTSVHACARLAAEKEYAGFCIADNSTCLTSPDFLIEYDTYNVSVQLDSIEEAAHKEFDQEIEYEKSRCLNATKRGALAAGLVYNASEAARNCTPDRNFVFNTTGLRGCLHYGMGGPETMSCYKLLPKPRWAAKPAPVIRCGQCARWISSMHTLRFIAEEAVEAGLDVTLGFTSQQLALRAPVHGLAPDDRSVVIMHSNDVRDVGVRDKERAICKIPPITPATQPSTYCVPPVDTQFQPDHSVPMLVAYKEGTFNGPSIGSFKVAPVDPQETEVPPTFEVASPMLSMVHTPDLEFTSSLDVTVPVNRRIMDWYAQEQTVLSLAGLEGRRQLNAQSGVTTYTHLWLHWFNAQTLTWVPIKGSQVRSKISKID
jgi:hypothetical protein